nr:hypothetical protein [Rhizobium anhuiense]
MAFDPSLTDRRAGDPLVETRERDAGVESWPHQGTHADIREIVSH